MVELTPAAATVGPPGVTIAVLVLAIAAVVLGVALLVRGAAARARARGRHGEAVDRGEEARRLAAIVESSDDAIIGKDLDGIITSWNAAAARMFGYRSAETIGRPITMIIPAERLHEEAEVLGRLRRGERVEHFETVRRARDGRLLDVSLTISPVRNSGGEIVGASKIARDIGERKRASEALRQSEATALALIESAAEGILIVDERGHILVANGQVEEMFGYAQGALVGQPMETLLPEGLRERHVAHRAGYVAEPRVRPMGRGLDLAGRRRDGSEFPLEISLSHVRTPRGLHVMAFITDIAERLRIEGTARQSEKLAALGTLSAGIAHELNNPLGIIISRAELILLDDPEQRLPPTVREDLGVIHRQAQRVARLVQALLSYARPSAPQRHPVDLSHVVDEILLLAEKQLTKAGVRLVTSLDRSLPPVAGDAGALEQVVLNLVTNAQQAMEGGGEVRIVTRRASQRAGWIELVVADTGPGIPADVLPRIFDPFFTTKPGGTGLGLSITDRIVRDHGGTTDVRSSAGEGTEFVLGFPATQPEHAG
jgi:PAS domain S-box-containing protein